MQKPIHVINYAKLYPTIVLRPYTADGSTSITRKQCLKANVPEHHIRKMQRLFQVSQQLLCKINQKQQQNQQQLRFNIEDALRLPEEDFNQPNPLAASEDSQSLAEVFDYMLHNDFL